MGRKGGSIGGESTAASVWADGWGEKSHSSCMLAQAAREGGRKWRRRRRGNSSLGRRGKKEEEMEREMEGGGGLFLGAPSFLPFFGGGFLGRLSYRLPR